MEQKLKRIMAQLFAMAEDEINDGSAMHNLRKWDSLKHMELVFAIEEEFEIPSLDSDEIVEMTSVAAIKRILANKGLRLDEQATRMIST